MFKAVFIDMDGTLLKSDHGISKASFETIQKLKEKNILVVLVSARPLHGMQPIAGEIGLLDFPLAALNGALIALKEKIMFESAIDLAITATLHQALRQYDSTLIYYRGMQWFSETKNSYTDFEQEITAVPIIIEPFADMIGSWQNEHAGPNKILVIANQDVTRAIQNKLKREFSDHLNTYTSKSTYLEVMSPSASKLNAVKFLIDQYHISQGEIIAIGDNFNDLEMITFAGVGIAMGNAPNEVKAKADYLTDSNDDDGVAHALNFFLGT
jgi:Cof subfamily protein (haloacid dehalogenase superfamily)